MKHARVISNTVQELFIPPDGFTINDCFHPSVVALFEVVPDNVQQGWIKHEDGSFTAPVPPVDASKGLTVS